MLFKAVSKADFLSYQPQFHTKSQERHKTAFGGLMQILLYLLNFSAIIYFSKDIYQRINPNVINSGGVEIFKSPVNIMKASSMFLAVVDQKTQMPFIDEKVYTIRFTHNMLDPELGITTTRELESERCSRDSFEEVIPQDILDSFKWEQYYCITRGQNVTLKGSYLDKAHWYLSAEVLPCEGKNCSESVKEKLTNTNVQVFLIDKFLDLNKHKDPVKQYTKMIVMPLTIGQKTTGIFRFKTINLLDDIGVLFQDTIKKTVYALNNISQLSSSSPSKIIFQLIIEQCMFIENISRKYKRLQEVVASVGGMLNVIFIVSRNLVVWVTEAMYYEELFLRFFNYSYVEKKPKGYSDPNADRTDQSKCKLFGFDPYNSSHINNYLRPKKMLTENQTGNKFNPSNTYLIPFRSNKNRCEEYFKTAMDFGYYLQKFKEIEILKLLLMTENQYSKFESILKNKISSELLIKKFIDRFESSNYSDENFVISQKLKKLEDLLNCNLVL
jgi:hypothetical protein